MNTFAGRLKTLRENKKRKDPRFTQGYLAKQIGVARPTYTAYENGTKQPSMETINKIANIFETTTDYLLGRSDNPNPNKHKEQTFEEWINDPETVIFMKDYLNAPEERKKELRRFWEFMKHRDKKGD